MNISRRLFGDGWVNNEVELMKILTIQQSKLLISVEEASEQVEQLKGRSQSTVKKGHGTMQP